MSSTTRSLSLAVRGAANYIRRRPLCVSFEITYNCNARCKHCHLGGSAPENRATPEEFGKISRELKPVVAQISGGEPLLRKDLEEVVRAIRRPGKAPFIVVTTNGSLLTREKYGKLREAGVDEISLSLDYPDERHDEFRAIPGLFQKIRTLALGLKDVRNSGITLSCVIQGDNFRELPRMAELAREWGVRMNFSSYTLLRTHKKEYMIPAEQIGELREILEKIQEFKRRYKTIFTSDYVLRRIPEYFMNGAVAGCRAGERFFVVNPDGTISPCGLIIRQYRSRKQMLQDFLKTNDCALCYTSIRANTEKPASYAIRDGLRAIRS